MVEVIGVDHIYISVSDYQASEKFYDTVMQVLDFRKQAFQLNDENHIQYYNRHFGYVIRPAHSNKQYDPYAPGLHHLCFRVESENDVMQAAKALKDKKINISEPKHYSEYAPDYFAFFFVDPDGLQLEVTNFRQERRERFEQWNREYL